MSTATDQESYDIRQQKKELRKKVKADLKLLTAEDIQSQSRQVWDKLIALPEYQSAKTVGVFLSMPKGEINTDFMLQHAHNNGKTLYIPEVGQNFEQSNMELVKVIVNADNAEKSKPVHYNWPRNKVRLNGVFFMYAYVKLSLCASSHTIYCWCCCFPTYVLVVGNTRTSFGNAS